MGSRASGVRPAAEGGLGRPFVSGVSDGTNSGLPEHQELRDLFRPDVPGNDPLGHACAGGL